MPFDSVALDEPPRGHSIAVGTRVIFPQGRYVLRNKENGTSVPGMRYHQGIITRVYADKTGSPRYDGEHVLKLPDGKMPFADYVEKFANLQMEQLRLAPNAIDALMANVEAS